MCLVLEAVLQPSLLSCAAILYVFTGGSKFFDNTIATAATICPVMNALFSVLLLRVHTPYNFRRVQSIHATTWQ